jgi:hypothetical protein
MRRSFFGAVVSLPKSGYCPGRQSVLSLHHEFPFRFSVSLAFLQWLHFSPSPGYRAEEEKGLL